MVRPAAGMVMAAGRGLRMRPLSDVLPKPALPILDRPLLRFALEQVAGTGTQRLVVNAWHLADAMEAVVERWSKGLPPVALSREPKLLGGAGGLALARDRGLLGDEGPVVVANGDVLMDLDLTGLLQGHTAAENLVTLALLPHPGLLRWSRVELGRSGRVEAIVPPGEGAGSDGFLYTGVMMVSREAIEALPPGPGGTAEHLWWPALRRGRLGGVPVRGAWREVGTPADYLGAVKDRLAGASWVDPEARVDPEAVVSSTMVGRGCTVGAGATVQGSVLAEGVTVERDATIVDSILLGPVLVRSGHRHAGQRLVAPG